MGPHRAARRRNQHVGGIKLSRNRGHQNALIAGLFTANGDALVSIDADLQDDINAIEEMVDMYLVGTDVVYGVRKQRETDTAFKQSAWILPVDTMAGRGVHV